MRVCGGAGQARNVCVCARCPAPVTPHLTFNAELRRPVAHAGADTTSMTDRGGASQDPPEADVEDLQRRSKSMPHRKDSTDSEAGRQVGFDLRLSSAGALSGAQGKLFKHASEAGDVLLKIFDDDSFQVYNRNEDTEAIVEACILHT